MICVPVVTKDALQPLRFALVQGRAWILEVTMQKDFSTGLLEWQLEER